MSMYANIILSKNYLTSVFLSNSHPDHIMYLLLTHTHTYTNIDLCVSSICECVLHQKHGSLLDVSERAERDSQS